MGRKKDLKELGKRGPGRKAKKQPQPPVLPGTEKEERLLKVKKGVGGRIKQRARRRVTKLAAMALEREQRRKKAGGRKKKPTEQHVEGWSPLKIVYMY